MLIQMRIPLQKVIIKLVRIVFNTVVIINLYLHLVLQDLKDHILIHSLPHKIHILNKHLIHKNLKIFNLMTKKIVF